MKKKVWNFDHQLLLTKSFPTTLKVCGIDEARETESIPQKTNQKRFFSLKQKSLTHRNSDLQTLGWKDTNLPEHPWVVCLKNTGDYIHTKASLELPSWCNRSWALPASWPGQCSIGAIPDLEYITTKLWEFKASDNKVEELLGRALQILVAPATSADEKKNTCYLPSASSIF